MSREYADELEWLPGTDVGKQPFALLEWGQRVRWVFLIVLAVAGTGYGLWIQAHPRVFLLWIALLLGLAALNLVHGRLLHRYRASSAIYPGGKRPGWITLLTAVDLVVITAVIHASGGPHSPVGWLFAAPIMLMSLVGGWQAGVPVAAAAWLLYAGLLVAQAAGWLPHIHPERIAIGIPPAPGETPAIVTPLLAHTAIMGFAVGLCSWFHAERKRYEERLQYLAARDPLTDLPNRRSLQVALDGAIARVAQGDESVLMFLDVDNLKIVNDSLGHTAGDRALLALVNRFRGALRAGDFLARLAGDEFVVLLERTSLREASVVAQRLREAAADSPVMIAGRPVYITVSIGLVPIDGSQTAEMLLSWADATMYRAKLQGRNQVVVPAAQEEDWARMDEHWAWVRRFKHALDENRFRFHYQPIVRLVDGRVAAYEALLRLEDENGRIVCPGEFLPIAEQAGHMQQIDRWVIEHALQVLRENPGVKLTVNLSTQALIDEELMNGFIERLRALNCQPPRLGVEITETTVIQDLDAARLCVERLRAVVRPVYLDDFGAGFNSFVYVRHLSAHGIKIDGSLIRDLKNNPRHQALVRAIKVLADGFTLETVAEYVEDEETARLLKQMGITYGQGYYFAKPTPEFAKLGELEGTG